MTKEYQLGKKKLLLQRMLRETWNKVYCYLYFGSFLQGLISIAVQCMCSLLVSLSHFNYRNNLITVLVPKMNDVDTLNGQVQYKIFAYSLLVETI